MGERKLLGPDLIRETAEVVDKNRHRLLVEQNRQRQYTDIKRRHIEFNVGDKVFLRVAPMKGVMRFGKKGKLSLRFVGLFEILE